MENMMEPHICVGSLARPVSYQAAQHENATTADTVTSSLKWQTETSTSYPYSVPVNHLSGADVICSILYSIVFILGTVGNMLVIVTLAINKQMATVTNCFLLSLAVSDFLVALVCIPITLIGIILQRFVFGLAMCKLFPYLMGLSVSVSTFTMLAISLERYYAICRPLRARGWQTKSHACKVIIGIWILSAILQTPRLVYMNIKKVPIAKMGVCTIACRFEVPNLAFTQTWYLFNFLVLFCIPGPLMTGAYGLVCKRIYKGFQLDLRRPEADASPSERLSCKNGEEAMVLNNAGSCVNGQTSAEQLTSDVERKGELARHKPGKCSDLKRLLCPCKTRGEAASACYEASGEDSRVNQTKKQLEAKKRVVEMLIVIVVIFFACSMPTFFANVWRAFDPETAQYQLKNAIGFLQLLFYIPTCINPVVYCFLNQKFRQAFLNIFCHYCCCLPERCRPALREAGKAPKTQHTMMTSASGGSPCPTTVA